ncbi:hypothetical protein IG631_11314 [Alternaria alternata]|nr:hypothetical protein IG631_11314 [Alternaria alternata]
MHARWRCWATTALTCDKPILFTPYFSHLRVFTITICLKYILSNRRYSLHSSSCTHRESQPCGKSHLNFECAAVRSRNRMFYGTRNLHIIITVIYVCYSYQETCFAHDSNVDPLSITGSLITAAQLAGETQTLLEASKRPSSLLSQVRLRVVELRNILDVLAQDIMRADRTMFSSQTIAVTQPVLMKMMEIFQNLLKIIRRSHSAESQQPHRRIARHRDKASLQQISEELYHQRILLDDLVRLITSESVKASPANLGDEMVAEHGMIRRYVNWITHKGAISTRFSLRVQLHTRFA